LGASSKRHRRTLGKREKKVPKRICEAGMKKPMIGLLMLCFVGMNSYAQMVSSLHQVMSSTSLINRPLVFRDMQANIQEEIQRTGPGLRVDPLHDRIGDFRFTVLAYVQKAPKIVVASDKYLQFELDGVQLLTVKYPDSQLLANWLDSFERELAIEIKDALDQLMENRTLKDAITAALVTALENSGATYGVETLGFDESYSAKLAKYLAGITKRELKRKMDQLYGGNEDLYNVAMSADSAKVKMERVLDDLVGRLRQVLAQGLDLAEHEVNKVVNEISTWLLSGNAGLGVTEGTGAFSGGLNVSYVWKTGQIGLYANGDLSKDISDDAVAGSLFGVQGRWADDRFQADVLMSKLVGPGRSNTYEAGLGFSVRLGDDIIVGAAHFNVFEDHSLGSTTGLTFRATSRTSPALLIGFSRADGETAPVFQIATPILPAK